MPTGGRCLPLRSRSWTAPRPDSKGGRPAVGLLQSSRGYLDSECAGSVVSMTTTENTTALDEYPVDFGHHIRQFLGR